MMFKIQNHSFVKFVIMYTKFYYVKKYTGVGLGFKQEDVFDAQYYGVWFGRANVCFIFVIH